MYTDNHLMFSADFTSHDRELSWEVNHKMKYTLWDIRLIIHDNTVASTCPHLACFVSDVSTARRACRAA